MLRKIITIFFSLVILSSCGKKIPNAKERIKSRDVWFENARKIVEASGNFKEAREILEFLQNRSHLCTLIPKGLMIVEPAKVKSKNFYLAPLIRKDWDGPWKAKIERLESFCVAHFQPDLRDLTLLNTEKFSDSWKGIILLHEGYHVKDYLNNYYDWKNQNVFCFHEIVTHNFQNRIVSALGGKEYGILLEKEVQRIKESVGQKNPMIDDVSISIGDYNSEFDLIFGPAKSEIEKNFRQNSFFFHAYFSYCDNRFSPEEAERQKVALYKAVYESKFKYSPASN